MNDFYPKGNAVTIIVLTLFVALSLSLLWLPPPAHAGPALQPPRPPLPEPPGVVPGDGEGGPGELPGTTIHGWVVNWNYHNEPHARLRLRGGGWDLDTTSDDNGYYYFKGLSTDNVLLNLVLPEGISLTPMTTDLALRTKGSGHLVVHLGLYADPTPSSLPVDISMSIEPEVTGPGSVVVYTIRATNRLPYSISQVLVTDYLPQGLAPIEVTVSPKKVTPTPTNTPTPTDTPGPPTATPTPGPPSTPIPLPPTDTPTPTPPPPTVEIWNNLVVADIGEMAMGDTAVVTIKARVEDNVLPGMVIHNRASFIYAENVAVQAMASLAIGGALPTGTPVAETLTAAVVPAAETLTVTATLVAAETLTMVVTPTVIETPGSPDGLPVTGFGLPIAGVLFALLVLVARLLRPRSLDET